jgi:DNA mismatch endonuclease (patch repair protein)|uniref:Very short patch repair endonuclease n=1 Tax=Thermus sp. 4C TaxID=446041 RepID=A6MN82_9DEIN|nr:very short patch repair endonuclease [Thermus sp. 4C]ABQ95626.1 putative DNA G:T-mismatch repair endonuclease [Thermus sp. 4C]
MDIFTPEKRSELMRKVKTSSTGPEVKLRRLLRVAGIRGYRIKNNLPGRPDVVFPKRKVAIFVDGCFWHGCPVCNKKPKTNAEFWRRKIKENRQRDARVDELLARQGWSVVRIWEHELKKAPQEAVARVIRALEGRSGL